MPPPRKRGGIPDLRPRGYSFPETLADGSPIERPDDSEVDALARRHGFPPDFDLPAALEGVWFWWRTDVQIGPEVPASVRRKFLRETARRAQALEQAIERAGIPERRAILDAVGSHNLDLGALKRSVHLLWLGAHIGEKAIPRSPAGRRGDRPLVELLCKLYRVYRKAFGDKARRLTRGARYEGRFFTFAEDVLKVFGITKTNTALGKLIEKAIPAVERWMAKHPESPK